MNACHYKPPEFVTEQRRVKFEVPYVLFAAFKRMVNGGTCSGLT